jgi:PilZ domain
MTPDMAFECLLVSRDPGVVCAMNNLLDKFSIQTNLCLSPSKAFDQLPGSTADLIILDWEEGSVELLQKIQISRKWQKPTIVAVSEMDGRVPGVHVVLQKPVTAESCAKSLKAAYSRMLYDHRRHARYSLMSRVSVTDESGQSLEVTVTDIGDGGVGISTKGDFTVGDVLVFHLLLPGTQRPIHIQARVQWVRHYGAIGCEFVRLPPVDLNILHDWLKNKNQVKKPAIEI